MNIEPIIRSVQSALGITVDGKAGPQTWQAIRDKLGITTPPQEHPADPVDERSEKVIATLLPEVQPLARALVHEAANNGIQIKIISGTRTYAEQDALFRQATDGRDNDGDGRVDESDERVTKARGGFSNHNFGIAFDYGVWRDGKYLDDGPEYDQVGILGKQLGLSWGGDWTFQDKPHFELKPDWAHGMSESEMVTELRNGRKAFA